MTFTHELSDFASRIRVAYVAKDLVAVVRLTRHTLQVVGLMYRHGLIHSFNIQNSQKVLLRLKYIHNRPFLKTFKVISTPGRRVYWNLATLGSYYNSQALNSFYIISTPLGLKTSTECLLIHRVSGEILVKVEF